MNSFLLLVLGLPLGVLLGALGSLTGIGGGFLLMPLLLLLLPEQTPAALSVVTLTVVFFNALSGTVLSAREERINYRTGLAWSPACWSVRRWEPPPPGAGTPRRCCGCWQSCSPWSAYGFSGPPRANFPFQLV